MVTRREDPVARRRARIARVVALGKGLGYSLLLLAIVAFAVAAGTGYPGSAVTLTVAALVAACIVLPAPIVLGYGLRAAEREDRAHGHGGEPGSVQR